nr:gelsolin, cytoplasmic-like [Danaus plexippus plexippus]
MRLQVRFLFVLTSGSSNLSWDIHFWLGSKTSQDEAGSAAILSVNLDDEQFQGNAVQHRETQGYESRQFLSYFEPAIRYLDGGHASGFNHVTVNAGSEKRLFQIKGKRNVRVRQVEASVASMNKGDCFILDVDHQILVYVGDGSKSVERMKAITVANQIRDQDHSGRGSIEIIGQYTDYTKNDLYQECYILDTSSSIYVWVGRHSNGREKAEAMKKAHQYLEANNHPSWVHISKVVEGAEPAAFKQHFQDWN